MLPVMRNGTSALAVRKRMPARPSTSRAAVAVVDGGELDLEALLALLGLAQLMGRQLAATAS